MSARYRHVNVCYMAVGGGSGVGAVRESCLKNGEIEIGKLNPATVRLCLSLFVPYLMHIILSLSLLSLAVDISA